MRWDRPEASGVKRFACNTSDKLIAKLFVARLGKRSVRAQVGVERCSLQRFCRSTLEHAARPSFVDSLKL